MTSPSPWPADRRQALGLAVARARTGAGLTQEKLSRLAGVSRKTLSNIETAGQLEPELQTIRKVDAALAQAAPHQWQVGRAEKVLTTPEGQADAEVEQPGPGAESGVVALAASLLARLDDEGYTAYRTARAKLRRKLGNDVLAEVDTQFERLAAARGDIAALRHTS